MLPSTGIKNLLEILPAQEKACVLKHSECIALVQGEILGEPGARIAHVYFPVDSVISLMAKADQRNMLGVGLIGCEGMLGASLVLDIHSSPLSARVESAGNALRMKAEDFERTLAEMPFLDQQLRRYLYILSTQFAQTAACAAFHVLDVRLACWLLMTQDRSQTDRFYLTHDRLACMLGVRRSGVTAAARGLKQRKLINYTRGHIVVLDRRGLEQAACSCYRVTRDMFKQIERLNGHGVEPKVDRAVSLLMRPAPEERRSAHEHRVRHAGSSGQATTVR